MTRRSLNDFLAIMVAFGAGLLVASEVLRIWP